MTEQRTTSFPALLAARRRTGDGSDFAISDDWLQGRTSFGGLIAAVAVQAMRDATGAVWPADVTLRALQTSFIAPIGRGDVHVSARVLRDGKSVRQVHADVSQDGKLCSVMLGVFAGVRESALAPRRPVRPAAARPVDALPTLPFIAGTTPSFMQHFEMRWAGGPPPFSGGDGAAISIHMRPRATGRSVSAELWTVLLADVSPTPVIGQFARPTPFSSVSWALELRPVADPGDGWWRADTEALLVDGGYVNQVGRLWEADGSLAALAYQVVAVYA